MRLDESVIAVAFPFYGTVSIALIERPYRGRWQYHFSKKVVLSEKRTVGDLAKDFFWTVENVLEIVEGVVLDSRLVLGITPSVGARIEQHLAGVARAAAIRIGMPIVEVEPEHVTTYLEPIKPSRQDKARAAAKEKKTRRAIADCPKKLSRAELAALSIALIGVGKRRP